MSRRSNPFPYECGCTLPDGKTVFLGYVSTKSKAFALVARVVNEDVRKGSLGTRGYVRNLQVSSLGIEPPSRVWTYDPTTGEWTFNEEPYKDGGQA
jgi:hypothetical protein